MHMNEPYASYDQASRWSARIQIIAQNPIPPSQADLSTNAPISQDQSQLIPAHIFRMFMPLGSWSDDELLVNALHDGERDGSTPRQVLEKLHGVNNYAAFMWKDYYLDHTSRIKLLVNKLRSPRNDSLIADPAPEGASSTIERRNSHNQSSSVLSFSNRNVSSRRSTINSLTARLTTGDSSSKPDIRIPDGPFRSPSPPVFSSTRERNKCTQQDSEYMLKLISWERSRNPNVSKVELSRKLAQKAPHHSFSSWLAHIKKLKSPLKMVVVPSSSSVGMQSDRQSVRDYQSEPGTSGTIDDLDEDSTDDGLNMGMPGEKYTTADRRLLAKYIATVEDWENKNDSERFENFHQRFPHRALTSWSRYYRRNTKELDKLSEKYKKQPYPISQVAHSVDSWASIGTGMDTLPSTLKRKFRVGNFAASSDDFTPKRAKFSV